MGSEVCFKSPFLALVRLCFNIEMEKLPFTSPAQEAAQETWGHGFPVPL
jgi:hypothetical protein